MSLSNKPVRSLYQVGETVYFLSGGKICEGEVVKVSTSVGNPLGDTSGVQENKYFLEGYSQQFRETELYHSKNAVLFEVKGDYLGKWGNSDQLILNSSVEFSYSDYSYSRFSEDLNLPGIFDGIKFEVCNLEGCNFESASLKNTSFSSASLYGAIMTYVDFTGAILSNCDFRGANLTGATLPSNANTKSTFKTVVGAGHWDPITTIWTDGNPIG
jgi:hypothetical protein